MTDEPDPKLLRKGYIVIGVVVAAFFLTKYLMDKTPSKIAKSKPVEIAKPLPNPFAPCVTVKGYVAASSEILLDRMNTMMLNKDDKAAALLWDQFNDDIIFLKGGDEVFVEDRKIFSGKLKIRPQGQTWALWTVTEAVKCP